MKQSLSRDKCYSEQVRRAAALAELSLLLFIIKTGWQCKAGRERLTPYQSEDPNHTTPTHRMKEEKGKTAGDKK